MSKKMLVLLGILVTVLIIGTIAYYWYEKPRAYIINIKPAYNVDAKELYKAFVQDEKKANKQYLEKVIQVKGIVDNVQLTDATISLLLSAGEEMGGINCSINKNAKDQVPQKGSLITVKGRCIGFLLDVNLVDAIVEK